MKRVKVLGAGSIGNHLANAARQKGWAVDICDIDPAALERTRELIYPTRYGAWDDSIGLYLNESAPCGNYDLIVVGTPPDSHIDLAREAIKEKPKAVLVEKPVCTPSLAGAQEMYDEAKSADVKLFVGYDHAISKSATLMCEFLSANKIGALDTLDVEFREYWGGIFAAHPWLDGPSDSYLGYWTRGGGACGEHSHALNLWQTYAQAAGAGKVVRVSANMKYINDGSIDYDKLCLAELETENGLLGRVVQDVVTRPTRKWARAQGADGFVEWSCSANPSKDTVILGRDDEELSTAVFEKTRPDDFIQELTHIETALEAAMHNDSAINIERGLETMLLIAACHKSASEGRVIELDYSRGFSGSALI